MKKLQETITQININWDFLSRLFIGFLFIYSAIEKIQKLSLAAEWLSVSLNMPITTSQTLLLMSVIIELILGTNLIIGKYKKSMTIKLLIIYVILVTLIVDYKISAALSPLFKNLAIVGGLIALLNSSHKKVL